jgi:hypothetical protein
MFKRMRKKIAERLLPGSNVRLSPSGRRYDWRPDLPDYRDISFRSVIPVAETLPPRVDLRPGMSPVVNQGSLGSCTGNAIAACLEYLQLKQIEEPGKGPQEYDDDEFFHVSRLFIYWNERAYMGTLYQDSGAFLRDGIKSLQQHGACRENIWPYLNKNVFKRPHDPAYEEARQYKISEYLRIRTLREMKQCLSQGLPFVFGFMTFESFESVETAATGIMKMPTSRDRDLGGHAVCAVGYDDDFTFKGGHKGAMIVRNSWGSAWGDKGYFYMPYDYISDPNLSDDFWAVRK